ncbi:heavy-metal-associated domain-containing protein [Labrenzia sp. R4_2]|uniref:heavy-metal-associated domain-containing protein n=1 Tax=Labrenzia sp. R4_2 TaxID=2821107 RepID=UPI001ADA3AE0|nr:heavy-metal-associated domain-containing protein [Labrenzia sp. R4_2]MBO9423026.1 heavy-metal-associated domain-containing protein [Labrenzia sp. R4_2]
MKFKVPEMSCGHCVSAIEKAVETQEAGAQVICNLEDNTVEVVSSSSSASIETAIREAGFEPQLIA